MKTILAGIDNGNGNIKVDDICFPAGVKQMEIAPPIVTNVFEMNGKFFETAREKTAVKKIKTESNDLRIGILTALAKKMDRLGIDNADVRLGIGAPLTRVGADRKALTDYMLANSTYCFKYENKSYRVHLLSVDVFPQGYSGVIDLLDSLGTVSVVVDIGTWTVDIMPLREGQPSVGECKSLALGTMNVINDINERLRQRFNEEADVALIKEVMIKGTANIREDYLSIIKNSLEQYTDEIIDNLKNLKINTSLTNIVFIGGGASIMRNHMKNKPENIQIIEDVCINAKGFEKLLAYKYKKEGETI